MSIKFIAGLLIGATVVHFLNTEEGKDLINRFKRDASRLQDDLCDLADDAVQKGKSFMNEFEEKVDEATS